VNRHDGQVWYRTAAQLTFEIILAVVFLLVWAGMCALVFLAIAWLAAML
jgi:hypothetical protein